MWRSLPPLLDAWALGCGDAAERDLTPTPDAVAGTRPIVTRNADGTFDVHATGQPRVRILDALDGARSYRVAGEKRDAIFQAFVDANWHFVEAYFEVNSIVGGIGLTDGVVQYWFDGTLVIDHQDVLLRAGVHQSMAFVEMMTRAR